QFESQALVSEPVVAPVSAPMPNLKPSIPYPLRRDNEKSPLIGNKEKLSEMARTTMNEHCSAVILNKLPRKLGDPRKFLIPCEFSGMDECLALADLGASINLMPLSVWEGLSLPELTPTCMTLELTDRSVSKPIGIAKDVSFKVRVFHFPAGFVVVDFEPDPRVPLILGRCFLKTSRSLIDVHKGELTLRIGNEAITYNLDQTVRYSANYNQMTVNKIDVIESACEEYSQEVLGLSNVTDSGTPTPQNDTIVSATSPTLTLFGDSNFLLFKEADAFLGLEDDPDSPKINPFYYDPEGDILLLEAILNSTSSSTPVISSDVAELKDMVRALLLDKKNQSPAPTPSTTPALVKAVESNCITCGGAHSYQNCPTTQENAFPRQHSRICVTSSRANYNQGNTGFRPQMVANQIRPLGFPPHQNNQNNFNRGNNFNQNRGGNFNQSNFNPPSFNQGQLNRPSVYQAPVYQASIPQTQRVSQLDFESYIKANDAILRNMQSQGQNTQNQCQNIQNQYQNLQSQMATLTEMMSKFVNANTASSSGLGTLPGNTVTNPKEDLKGITTRSGVAYHGPKAPSPSKQETNVTKVQVQNPSSQNTAPVQPSVIQFESQALVSEPVVAPVSAPMPNLKPSIPYPLRRDNEKSPLIGNKEKLSEIARTTMNEHCSAVILNKLPRKLGDPGKFLIPCEFSGMDECLALADLGDSINLMPLSVWEGLSLPELTPTCMTLELADHSVSKPLGIAKDVSFKVGVFHFPADFVVVDFEPDPRVPLILGRCFLKTSQALIDVHKEELTLHIGNEAITYNLDQTNLPSFKEELKAYEAKTVKSSVDEPLEVELKDLPHHLEYAFLEGDNKLPVIIAKEL
nr:reverse transcriptase domain-containing protein [Tanacetum cinerariifolium]